MKIFDKIWYDSLKKPRFQPSAKIFPIVWAILYLLMAISLGLIIFSPISNLKMIAIAAFTIQLGINLMWTRVFFKKHNLKESYELTVVLTFYLLVTIFIFYQISPFAAILLFPYLIWSIFAAFLMYNIYRLNN